MASRAPAARVARTARGRATNIAQHARPRCRTTVAACRPCARSRGTLPSRCPRSSPRKSLFDDPARARAHGPRPLPVRRELQAGARPARAVAGRTSRPVARCVTTSGTPPTAVATTGSERHRFEQRHRHAFGERRQHEDVHRRDEVVDVRRPPANWHCASDPEVRRRAVSGRLAADRRRR